jgi:hypothetical protein
VVSPSGGVNTVTGEELKEAMAGAQGDHRPFLASTAPVEMRKIAQLASRHE